MSSGMIENLLAELFGVALSGVLFVWVAGLVARRVGRKSFDLQWLEYRRYVLTGMKAFRAHIMYRFSRHQNTVASYCEAHNRDAAAEALDQIMFDTLIRDLSEYYKIIDRHHFALSAQSIVEITALFPQLQHTFDELRSYSPKTVVRLIEDLEPNDIDVYVEDMSQLSTNISNLLQSFETCISIEIQN